MLLRILISGCLESINYLSLMTASLPFSTEAPASITSLLTEVARRQPRKGIVIQIVPFLAFACVGPAADQFSNITLSCCNNPISCVCVWKGMDTYWGRWLFANRRHLGSKDRQVHRVLDFESLLLVRFRLRVQPWRMLQAMRWKEGASSWFVGELYLEGSECVVENGLCLWSRVLIWVVSHSLNVPFIHLLSLVVQKLSFLLTGGEIEVSLLCG